MKKKVEILAMLQSKLTPCPLANIRLGCKDFPGTNTQSFFATSISNDEKNYYDNTISLSLTLRPNKLHCSLFGSLYTLV
jgi:hypothetical protein